MKGKKEKKRAASEKDGKTSRVIMILGVLFALLAVVFIYSVFRLSKDLLSDHKDKKGFEELSAIISEGTEESSAQPGAQQQMEQTAPSAKAPADAPVVQTHDPATGKLLKYVQLSEMNPEFFGWLKIEGLEIDYPVMYSPSRPQHYLNRDFYGENSDSGIPFIDERCPAEGNYYLIYGHLMRNKSVFGRLPQYAEESCWKENPVIRFDTLTEEREYAVMACFYSRIYADYEQGFRYYDYFDLTDEKVFNDYVAQAKENAIYETGVTAEFGDELLVLTTCSHHEVDGRFAVVAKRIS